MVLSPVSRTGVKPSPRSWLIASAGGRLDGIGHDENSSRSVGTVRYVREARSSRSSMSYTGCALLQSRRCARSISIQELLMSSPRKTTTRRRSTADASQEPVLVVLARLRSSHRRQSHTQPVHRQHGGVPTEERRNLSGPHRIDPGLLHNGDPAVRVFTDRGWRWGGSWRTP